MAAPQYGELGKDVQYDPGLYGQYAGQAASNQGLVQGNTIKPDGLVSILNRIESIASEFGGDVYRMGRIADQLSGARPENPNKAATPVEPQAALFLARKIEVMLQETISAQRQQIARIEQAIG